MIIGKESDFLYINAANSPYEIRDLPKNRSDMINGNYYIVGDLIYEYIGEVKDLSIEEIPQGCIGKFYEKYFIHSIPESSELYDDRKITSIVRKEEYDKLMSNIESLVQSYITNFKSGNNVAKDIEEKMRASGETYVPVIKDTDDVLTRMMKLMIIDKKIVLSNYKNNGKKDYSVDNLRSALNGTTVNMTISKFLDWCNLLGLEWKFEIFDDPDIPVLKAPLGKRLTISSDQDLWVDVGEHEPGIFKVPLSEKDDPLKKLIKVAVYMKRMVLTEYKDRGSTPHLLNNMRSALKRSSKMMITYFVFWCEILELTYNFEIYDPETGIRHIGNRYYKMKDYVEKTEDE